MEPEPDQVYRRMLDLASSETRRAIDRTSGT